MFLRKYKDSDFPALQSWVTDPELLFRFAGDNWSFPLSLDEVKRYQDANTNKQSYILCDDSGIPVAFGELIIKEPHAPRLGRLLVGGSENRGKGIGTKLINLMIAESRRNNTDPFIKLFVFDDNVDAIRCYKRIGFKFDENVKLSISAPNGSLHQALLMVLDLN
ncbi:MAG TPA: GNAT family N-acetyltransferase [Dyadobacter sp.]|nr:GNAT family N-acetyltransferase [Dyadobacter sp.]